MLKGGVIMDVTTPEQAKIAERTGDVAVMALERIPADIRAAGGVSRMSDPHMIKEIQEAVSIPVIAKVRIGILQKPRFWKLLILTISTRARYFRQPMESIISTKPNSRHLLSVEPKISEKHCAVSPKVLL